MSESFKDFSTLLAAAKSGDQFAISELIKQYEPKVSLVARVQLGRALRPYLDTVDLVQSVHRSLILGLRYEKFHFSNPEQLIALAITIVRRKVARQWRKMQRQCRLENEPAGSSLLPERLASLSDVQQGPASEAQFLDQLEHLCNHLDHVERRMLELRLQGYTSKEVGDELGMHAVAVRVRWTRLRRSLQDHQVATDWL